MSNYWSETDKSIEFQYVPNGSIGSLIQKTKEKIQQAISKLGYIPIGKTKIFEHVWDRVLKEIRSTSSWYTFYKGEIEKEKRHLRDIINVHNDIFVDSQKSKYDKFPMLKKLNKQQQMAVYNEEKNTLVVAGAGCGKSTTILGKVAYLIESGKATEEEILLLSYTNDTANDLNIILKQYEMPEIAQTFHKLGKSILEATEDSRLMVLDNAKELITDFFTNNNADLQDILYRWFSYYKDSFLSFKEFDVRGDYATYLESLSFEAIKSMLSDQQKDIKGRRCHSLPEVLIANWLFENGVEYEYERLYTDKFGKAVCKPDFYLPEYDIWIEHWGVMENDTVPWLKDKVKVKKYIDAKKSKQLRYKNDDTKVIDLHLYEFYNRTLTAHLKQSLTEFGVKLTPLTTIQKRDVVKQLIEREKLSSLVNLIDRFLCLFKSNGYTTEQDLRELQEKTCMQATEFDNKRINIFFELFKRFYKHYNNSLSENKLIDFSDMIRCATNAVVSGKWLSKYKYILIDEFQDIAKDRCSLVLAIQNQTNASCFCVGDDWQSIYRFNGGDLRFFVNFGEYFPDYKEFLIEDTFRSGQELVDLAGRFIQKNPYQKRKKLKSQSKYKTSVKAFINSADGGNAGLQEAVSDIVNNFGANAEIMLLIRNRTDLDIFKKDGMEDEWELRVGDGNNISLHHKKHSGLQFKVYTVHKSKGLQADVVLILNMTSGPLGFPNQIMDDKLLSELLVKMDLYPYAEERRLFYVALTRAKKACYLIVPTKSPSLFWNEISHLPHVGIFGAEHKMYKCPKCSGYLVMRSNGKYGCSNYKPGTYTSCSFMLSAEEVAKVSTDQKQKQSNESNCCDF